MRYYEDFKIRSYGKGELACLYMPNLTVRAALKAFSKWLKKSPGLEDELIALGWSKTDRKLTPQMVMVIVQRFGEP